MRPEDTVRAEAARLRALLGIVPDDENTGSELSPADSALLARILTDTGSPSVTSGERPRRRLPVPARIGIACASIAAVVVAAVAVQSQTAPASATPTLLTFSAMSVEDVFAGQAAPAHPALTELANAAAAQPVVHGEGSQVVTSYGWYWNQSVTDKGSTVELAPTYQTTTIAPDGSFDNREVRAPALDAAGLVIDPDHYPAGGKESHDSFPAGSVDPDYPSTLPRDPAALREAMLASQGGKDVCGSTALGEGACLFGAAIDLETRWVVPSDLTAALWTVLAGEPELVDMGTTTDRLGREGHAVALPPDPATTNEVAVLVIDPKEGQLLSWEHVAASIPQLEVTDPAVTGFQAIASAEWVDGPSAAATGGDG